MRIMGALAAALIAVWVGWWVQSVRHDALAGGRFLWVPTLPFIAGDFAVSLDHYGRLWAAGINPYQRPDDWVCANIQYPPVICRLFTWVALVSKPVAVKIWLAVLSGLLLAGAYASWRTRRALGLWPVRLAVIVVALIYSTPAITAMERGQCDPLVIPPMLAASWLLRRRGTGREIAAGGVLGFAAWLKYYPGLTIIGLLALRRRKAVAAFVVIASLIGLVDRANLARSIETAVRVTKHGTDHTPIFFSTKHSLVEHWPRLWLVRRVHLLRQIPAPVAAGILLVPTIAIVSRRVGRAREPEALILPYFLWLTAAATFGMPQSIDYNLVPLPLAALGVWDRRDLASVHAVMILSFLWWQPFALPVTGELLLLLKLAALYAVATCLVYRAGEAPARESIPPPHVALAS